MADITLGTPINGSIASTDPKLTAPNPLASFGFDEYSIAGLPSFNQVEITVTPDATLSAGGGGIQIVNAATGAVLSQNSFAGTTARVVTGTSFPGINYKVLVVGAGLGNYKLEMTDAGKATSIVTPVIAVDNGFSQTDVGTVGPNSEFYPLGSSTRTTNTRLFDVALAANNKLYGIGPNSSGQDILYAVDPGRAFGEQITPIGTVKDAANVVFSSNFNALEFAANKLYAIGLNKKLYTIDPTATVATVVGDLPTGFFSSGDLVYDAAGSRFLATSATATGFDELWSIPVAAPATATKIGTTNIGFKAVTGLSFEGTKLTGFTSGSTTVGDRVEIDLTTGTGRAQDKIGDSAIPPLNGGISGASTITSSTPTPTPTTTVIGTKGQSLTQRTIDLTDYPGTLKADVKTNGDAAYVNNVGFYVVQDASGSIVVDGKTIKPGEANYAAEAVKSAILRAGKNDSQLNQNVAGGRLYAPVVVAQGSLTDFVNNNPSNGGDGKVIHAYFNYLGANPDNFDHFKLTAPNTFAVEDQYGGGDRDFNDLIVNLNIKTA